jgi:hypothetical protein
MTTALEALARLSRQEPTPEYFIAFQEEINAEKNDRGAAILLACNVEICLRFAIDRNLTLGIDAYKRSTDNDGDDGQDNDRTVTAEIVSSHGQPIISDRVSGRSCGKCHHAFLLR